MGPYFGSLFGRVKVGGGGGGGGGEYSQTSSGTTSGSGGGKKGYDGYGGTAGTSILRPTSTLRAQSHRSPLAAISFRMLEAVVVGLVQRSQITQELAGMVLTGHL